MNRWHRRIMLKTAALIMVFAVPSVALFSVFAVQRIFSAEKQQLKGIAISILVEMAKNNESADGTSLTSGSQQTISRGLRFVSPDGEMWCRILGKDHRILWQTPQLDAELGERFFAEPERNKLFLFGLRSDGEKWQDRWSNWRFVYRREQGGFTVFVSNVHDFELAERAIEWGFLGLSVALFLVFGSAWLHTRSILDPFAHIHSVMAQVSSGDLQARIDTSRMKHETRDLGLAINSALEDLADSFARISQFSSDAAHELRTPLTAVCGTLEVALAKPRAAEEYEDLIAKCLEQMSGLRSMTEKLLLLARPGDLDLDSLGMVDLGALARDQAEALEVLAEIRNVHFEIVTGSDTTVKGDAELLGTMLRNLMDNAIKASPDGGTVEINVAGQADGQVRAAIKDQGPGIPKDAQDKIFERFFQLDESRSASKGLGLSMVRWIIESHHGTIDVVSNPGEGAEFVVCLDAA